MVRGGQGEGLQGHRGSTWRFGGSSDDLESVFGSDAFKKAYMPVYKGSRFSLRTGGRASQTEVVKEVLADLFFVSTWLVDAGTHIARLIPQRQLVGGH